MGQLNNVLSTVVEKRGRRRPDLSGGSGSIQVSLPLSGLADRVVLGAGLTLFGRSVASYGVSPGIKAQRQVVTEWVLWTLDVVGRSGPTLGGC